MKQMIRIVTAAILLAATATIAAERPPNFIFILSDDIAQGDLGCYPDFADSTPISAIFGRKARWNP